MYLTEWGHRIDCCVWVCVCRECDLDRELSYRGALLIAMVTILDIIL